MAKRVIIIHGFQGDPNHGWKPWLKKELEKRGFLVKNLQMPNPNHPKVKSWVNYLANQVGEVDSNCYLVGHSLGCITILRYLETLKNKEKIGGAVLVAGPIKAVKKEIKSFFDRPIRWAEIKKHCKRFVAINSDNDPYIPLEHGRILKEKLGAKLIIKKNHKHFSSSDGFVELPIVLEGVLGLARG